MANFFGRTSRAVVCMAGGAIGIWAIPSSATVIDLVTGNTGTANGVIYDWVDVGSTGTGVIEPFLRVQNNGTEQGYNNDVGTPWDTKAGIWTHDLLLSDLIVRNIGGVNYFEFLLDINQNRGGTNELLSLNNVQIFTRAGAITSAPDSLAGLGTLRFNMDTGAQGDTTVELDFSRNPGSGYGDMLMYVPVSLFAGAASTDNVYFYTLFGTPNGTNDGFEEWALRTCIENCSPPDEKLPEPGTLALLGLGLLGLGLNRRKRVA